MQCHVCGSQFVSASALSKHRQQHEKTWKCGICDQRFSRKDRMDCHVAGHSSIKLYHFWLLGDTIYGLCQHQKRAYVISQHPFESMLYDFSDSAHDTFISFILWYFHAFEKFCLLTVYVELSAYQGVQRVLYNDDWSGHRPGLRDYITRACNSNWLWSGMKCTMHGWSRRGGFRLFEIITWQQTVIGPRCIYASIDMVVQNYEINRYKIWHP